MKDTKPKLNLSEPVVLEVDEETLRSLDCARVEAQLSVDDWELRSLFSELHKETIGHTWKYLHFDSETSAIEQLREFEEKRRPTQLFFYYATKNDGSREFFGAGTVAKKISHMFPYDGFPVIARCYIKGAFRAKRLYSPVLKHRFDYCRTQWGSDLRAIHLGSNNPRVFRAIMKSNFVVPFTYIGDEDLGGTSKAEDHVRDFLWLSDSFRRELTHLHEMASGPLCLNFKELLQRLFENRFRPDDYAKLKIMASEMNDSGGWTPLSNLAFRQLLTMAAAIPVLESSNSELIDHEIEDFVRRKKSG